LAAFLRRTVCLQLATHEHSRQSDVYGSATFWPLVAGLAPPTPTEPSLRVPPAWVCLVRPTTSDQELWIFHSRVFDCGPVTPQSALRSLHMSRVLCVSMSLALGLLVASVYGRTQLTKNEIVSRDSLDVCLGGCGNQYGAQIACATGGEIAPCPTAPTCSPLAGNVCQIVTTSSSQTCNNVTENYDCTLTCGGNCAKVYYGTSGINGCTTCPSPGSGCGAAACTSSSTKC
jgi:hypothetical protein